MSVNKKYYYMRLKENFFDTDEMILLESMPDGILYSNILIKLYLKSLKYEGRLLFRDHIPYNSEMIATVTRHPVGVVEKALQTFNQLGLVDVLPDDVLYMSDIELMIGKTSTEADRKRLARMKIEQGKLLGLQDEKEPNGQMSDNRPPENRVKSLEKDLELKKDKTSCVTSNEVDVEAPKKSKYKFSEEDMVLSKLLFQYVKKLDPKAKEPNFEYWANAVRLMREVDKRNYDEIKEVIIWCQNDDFWKGNILSTTKLRKQFSKLVIRMNQERGAANGQQGWKQAPRSANQDKVARESKNSGFYWEV